MNATYSVSDRAFFTLISRVVRWWCDDTLGRDPGAIHYPKDLHGAIILNTMLSRRWAAESAAAS